MNQANEKYIKVTSNEGEDFLCPVTGISSMSDVSDHELESCVEQDVVMRHIGNIDIDAGH